MNKADDDSNINLKGKCSLTYISRKRESPVNRDMLISMRLLLLKYLKKFDEEKIIPRDNVNQYYCYGCAK